MRSLSIIDYIAIILVIVGGLNWGLFGLPDLNPVPIILGTTIYAKIVYSLVGLSALYALLIFLKPGKKE